MKKGREADIPLHDLFSCEARNSSGFLFCGWFGKSNLASERRGVADRGREDVPGNNSNFSTTGWPRQQNSYEFRLMACHKGGTAGPDIAMLRRRAPTSVSRKGEGMAVQSRRDAVAFRSLDRLRQVMSRGCPARPVSPVPSPPLSEPVRPRIVQSRLGAEHTGVRRQPADVPLSCCWGTSWSRGRMVGEARSVGWKLSPKCLHCLIQGRGLGATRPPPLCMRLRNGFTGGPLDVHRHLCTRVDAFSFPFNVHSRRTLPDMDDRTNSAPLYPSCATQCTIAGSAKHPYWVCPICRTPVLT